MYSKYNLDQLIIGKYSIDDIFLLSTEEYKKYKNLIPTIDRLWWLRSPGITSQGSDYALSGGSYNGIGTFVDRSDVEVKLILSILPALRISTLNYFNFKSGDIIVIFDRDWIVLDKDLVIAKFPIGKGRFDKNSNNYEKSEIKQYLQDWLKEQREKYNK